MRGRAAGFVVSCLLAGLGVVLGAAPASATTLAAPTLSAPAADAQVSANPMLQWQAVPGALRYRVQISQSSTFSSVLYGADAVGTQVTPDQDLALGDLYWRVAAVDHTGSVGPFSAPRHLTKTWAVAPDPISPKPDPATDPTIAHLVFPTDPAVFRWNPLPGATSYTLEIDDATDFIGATDYTTTNLSYTLSEPQTAGQVYYWRVRAQSTTAGVNSQWSAPLAYEYDWLSKPTLTPPPVSDDPDITDVVFSWTAVPGAASYRIQVSPNQDWANNVIVDTTVKSTSYTPTVALANGGYFWRVQAIDAASPPHFGPFTDAQYFERAWTARPTQLTPAWDPTTPATAPHISAAPNLSWTPVAHAAYYELQVSTDVNFSTWTNCFTNHTEWTPYSRLLPLSGAGEPQNCQLDSLNWAAGTTYFWRVRGIDAPAGIVGHWSATANGPFRFVRDPSTPTLLAPTDTASVSTPILRWSPIANVDSYRVTIKGANNSTLISVNTYAPTYTPTSLLSPQSGPFSWYVQTVDGAGVVSAVPDQSQWFHFSTVAPTTSATLSILTPDDNASGTRMPSMSWTPVTNATSYIVHYKTNGTEQTPLATALPYAAFTATRVPPSASSLEWWVEAQDNTGKTIALSTHRTFTVNEPQDIIPSSGYHDPAGCDAQHICADTPTLSWDPSPDAAVYVVTIANDRGFTNIVRRYVTAYTTLTPRESLLDNQAGQAYYWFVMPCMDVLRTDCGPASDNDFVNGNAHTFQKHSAPVELLGPADNSNVVSQTSFHWRDYLATGQAATPSAAQEAQQYNIEVSTVADFASYLEIKTVDGTSYTPTGITYPNGPIYWRVQAIDGTGNTLTWSKPRLVTKVGPSPAPLLPANNDTVGGVPFLKWTPENFAARYIVELARNGDTQFSQSNLIQPSPATTKFSAWAPTVGLPQGDYAWHVRAVDADGLFGPWSTPQVFHLSPNAPNLLTPAATPTLTSSNVVFSWTPVSGATQYRWQLSTDAGFGSPAAQQTTVMTSWSPLYDFADGSYFWRVQALDGNNNVIASSASRALSKDATSPTVTQLSPTSAWPVAGAVTATFSEPVTNIDDSSFSVVPQGEQQAVRGSARQLSATSASWTPSAPLVPGQTYTVTVGGPTRDLAGNAVQMTPTTIRTELQVDNTSPAWTEHWDRDNAGSASGGSVDASRTAGSAATLTFTGTSISIVGTRAPSGGNAAVYLDGARVASSISFYNRSTQYRHVMWSRSGLANTSHIVRLVPLGTKSGSASDSWVYLDAFRTSSGTVEQTSAAVRETFARSHLTPALQGSVDSASHATSGDTGSRPSFSLTFRGTSITVVAEESPAAGNAVIYLDNHKVADVPLRSTSTTVTSIYSGSGLPDRVHTLRVEPAGTSNGNRSTVALDYAQVY